jgi:hypothetical protein
MLLAFICGARHNYNDVWAHVDNGLRLFFQWRIWDREGPRGSHQPTGFMPVNSMVAMFCRLDSQTINLRKTSWQGDRWIHILQAQPPSGKPFESPTEAYHAFEIIWNGIFGLTAVETYRLPSLHHQFQPTPDAWHTYRRLYEAWKIRFQALQREKMSLLYNWGRYAQAMGVLEARKLLVDVVFSIDFAERELRWDRFEPEFKKIVDFATALLQPMARSKRVGIWHGNESHTFSFGPSLSEPLYAVARGCRTRPIREEAIELLRRCPVVEGVAHAHLMAGLAESIMNYEHEMAWGEAKAGESSRSGCGCLRAKYICGNHRVCEERIAAPEKEGEMATVYVQTEWDRGHSEAWQKLSLYY